MFIVKEFSALSICNENEGDISFNKTSLTKNLIYYFTVNIIIDVYFDHVHMWIMLI